MHATLRRPRNFGNPGAIDGVGALARRGIWVVGWAPASRVRVVNEGRPTILDDVRDRIRERIGATVPPREATLLRALVLGEAGAVSEEVRRSIARAGLAHLLAVSGLHVGLVWGGVAWFLTAVGSRSEWLLLRTNVRGIAALLPAVGYAVLAGHRVPAFRAAFMVLLAALAVAAGRETRAIRIVALAAIVVAAARPGAPLDISFQLSFAAVTALVAVAGRGSAGRMVTAFRVSSAAFAGTAALVAFHFHRISPIALLTNPPVVPLVAMPATVLGLAGGAVSFVHAAGGGLLLRAAGFFAGAIADVSELAAGLPGASLAVPPPTLVELALLAAAGGLLWVSRQVRRRGAIVLVLLALFDTAGWVHERRAPGILRVRFLDVGQGDSTVVELPGGRVLVIDGGGFARSHFNVGERVVARYLRTRRILRVDWIAATHGDIDHQGGLEALARDFAPRELWRSEHPDAGRRLARLGRAVRAAGGRVRPLRAGETVVAGDGWRIECLHPPVDSDLSPNDASLVLRVVFGEVSVLLTGDIEAAGERELVRRAPGFGRLLLKVPHHGSGTSSGEGLLSETRPVAAIVSVAEGNRYRLPAPDVLRRFRRRGVRLWRTDRDGSIAAWSRGRFWTVQAFRESSLRTGLCGGVRRLC